MYLRWGIIVDLLSKTVRKLIVPAIWVFSMQLTMPLGQAHAANYHALIIGAESYREYPLSTAANNASSVAEKFKTMGFDVDVRVDRPNHELRESVRLLGEKAKNAEFTVLYYSGQTIKLGGNQYLIPSDVDLRSRADLRKLVDIQLLLAQLKEADVALVILDGCAQARFARGWGDTFGRSPVCANEASQLQLPANTTLVVSDSAADTTTLGVVSGRLNLYTQTFLEMVDSDAPITDVMENVNAQVVKRSDGAQLPQVFGNTQQQISFRAPASGAEIQTNRVAGASTDDGLVLVPGVYQIENTRNARFLAVDRRGSLGLASTKDGDPSGDWLLESTSTGTYFFRSRQNGKTLVVDNSLVQMQFDANDNADSATWQLPLVEFGSPGERNISSANGSLHLSVRDNAIVLSRSRSASAAGWVFRRIGDIDDETLVRTVEIEPDDTLSSLDSSASGLPGAADNTVLTTPTVDPPSDILSDEDIASDTRTIASMVFRQFKASLEARALDQIKQMMRPGSSLDAFAHLIIGYDKLIADLSEVTLDQSSNAFHADLTVLQLQLGKDFIEPIGVLRKARLVLRASDINEDAVILARHCRPNCIPTSGIIAAFQGAQ